MTVLFILPAMSIVGIFAGVAIGIAANYALTHVKLLKNTGQKSAKVRETTDNQWTKVQIEYTTKVRKLLRICTTKTNIVVPVPALQG